MLTCDNLVLEQGAFRLIADVTFQQGAITVIIGPSGAGKSTFLSAIAGFLGPSSGVVSFDDDEIHGMPPGKRPVSMLFQDNNLFPHLSVTQNVALALTQKRWPSAEQLAKVWGVLRDVGLPDDAGDRTPALLSGGQQSRVALARVLLSDKPVVLLDEPFAALGPGLKDEMLDLTQQMLVEGRGATVLMVTHDPDDARRIADDVAWVADGVVTPPRAMTDVFANPPDAMRTYLGKMG